nr:ATP/GTP-binding protein [uncultured Acidovorax sp.]
MECSILFMGPVGAGKTAAVQTLSDIDVAGTEESATDETAALKTYTTVCMDAGVLELGQGDKVRLIGAPGQDRFDFMWDILLEQAQAVVLLVNHGHDSRLQDLDHFMDRLGECMAGRRMPLAVGVTHIDLAPDVPLSIYRDRLTERADHFPVCVAPVQPVDARKKKDLQTLVLTVAAMLEMVHRYGS